MKSELLNNLSSCHNCFYRACCKKYESYSDTEKDSGCKDIRSAFLSVMKELTQPETFLAKQIAEIQVEADIRKLQDGKLGEGLSKDRMRLYNHLKDFTKLYLDLQDMRAKYGIGTKQTIIHKFKDDETITIHPKKEEDKDN